jgi:Zinc finger, C2H2 type
MSENQNKIIEQFHKSFNENKSVKWIVNNIQQEPEVEFVSFLPPKPVEVEKFEAAALEPQKQTENYDCRKCWESFNNPQSLAQHIKYHKPKIQCPICMKNIGADYLKFHLERHDNVKKFKCDICAAGFLRKLDLAQHTWKHRSDKQFNCAQCNRGFNGRDNYKAHLFLHSANPRPFQCDLCPKNYARKAEIKTHLATIHSEQSFKCKICGFKTKWKHYLKIHKKKVHPPPQPLVESKACKCLLCSEKVNERTLKIHFRRPTKD